MFLLQQLEQTKTGTLRNHSSSPLTQFFLSLRPCLKAFFPWPDVCGQRKWFLARAASKRPLRLSVPARAWKVVLVQRYIPTCKYCVYVSGQAAWAGCPPCAYSPCRPPSVLVCSVWHNRVRTLGGLNSRHSLLEVLEASSAGSRCQLIRLLPEEGSLPESQVADFSVGLHMASPQCVNMEREREGAGRKGEKERRGGKGGRGVLFYKKATYKGQ